MGKSKKKSKTGGYEMSPDIRRVIPLGNNYCYIADDQGKLHHLKRNSEEALEMLRNLDALTTGKITKELETLGWEEILEGLTVEHQS